LKTKHRNLLIALCLLCLLSLLLPAGCGGCRDKATDGSREIDGDLASVQSSEDMFLGTIDNLNNLERYNSVDSLQELRDRFLSEDPLTSNQPIDPLLAAWPEPEMFKQVLDELNQWIRLQPPPADWKLDPLVAGLPKPLQELPQMKHLDKMELSRFDGFALQEATWLRDVALSAQGDVVEDLDRARNLFDWTVRNIQLEADRPNRIPQLPRETLLFGRGTPSERAWVFILLLRQLDVGIDAAMLAINPQPTADNVKQGSDTSVPSRAPGPFPARQAQPPPRPWCVGVLIGREVYLFDPLLGLPIPAPRGVTIDESGQLAIRPATLAQVATDPKLLRQLDIDEWRPYRVKSVDPERVTALLEASPPYLARPMKAIESHLLGPRKMVLAVSPTAQAERWKAAHVTSARLWRAPFDTLARRLHLDWRISALWLRDVLPLFWVYQERSVGGTRTSMDPLEYDETRQPKESEVITHAAPLYKGRVLFLKGKFTGDDGAATFFRIARPSLESLRRSSASADDKQIQLWAKQDATYWSGLIAYQRGNYPSAVDHFLAKTIEAYPDGLWLNGARYNLARTYEGSGKPDLAIIIYKSNTASPGYPGDLLRAKWLIDLGAKPKAESE
jgi:hypothetical protein